ncbi:MAG: TIGR01212 family radical SAM protein [Desulfuromonadales bacterium]|nr:TIGR01212 family radical SAM protein [Desulfuromonadales bacterium]
MEKKRYNLYSNYLKEQFGSRVHKISVDAGFGCPNRAGGRSASGCIYCDPTGSGSVGLDRRLSIAEQLEAGKGIMQRKYKAQQFIAYFQPFSNTFAPVATLRALYDEALADDGVVGLAIGTRPDCLPDDVLDLLGEYARRTDLWLEIGVQSSHDRTLQFLRRGHDYSCFLDAIARARQRGLRLCAHLILGLPGEDRAAVLATTAEMARLQIDGVKLHLLHILAGTELGDAYQRCEIPVLEQKEYVALACDVLERLPAATVIQRLTGDGPRDRLLAPLWSLKKWEVLNAIDAELERRDTRQGDYFSA